MSLPASAMPTVPRSYRRFDHSQGDHHAWTAVAVATRISTLHDEARHHAMKAQAQRRSPIGSSEARAELADRRRDPGKLDREASPRRSPRAARPALGSPSASLSCWGNAEARAVRSAARSAASNSSKQLRTSEKVFAQRAGERRCARRSRERDEIVRRNHGVGIDQGAAVGVGSMLATAVRARAPRASIADSRASRSPAPGCAVSTSVLEQLDDLGGQLARVDRAHRDRGACSGENAWIIAEQRDAERRHHARIVDSASACRVRSRPRAVGLAS